MTSYVVRTKKCPRAAQASGHFLFLPHMTSYSASITEQTTGKCNLFVLYNKIEKIPELNSLFLFPQTFGSRNFANITRT